MKSLICEKEVVKMEISTAKQNDDTTKMLIDSWMLGPKETSIYPEDNKEYWKSLAKVWQVDEKEARRRLCANCEYFNNTNTMMAQMEKIPLNRMDADGGGRGYCHKFDFICHNLRTCQAWEAKEFKLED